MTSKILVEEARKNYLRTRTIEKLSLTFGAFSELGCVFEMPSASAASCGY